jgi:type IV pilus assembly protein PilO
MRRSFNIPRFSVSFKNTVSVLQTAAGALLAATLIAGWFVVRPLGGSAAELSDQAASLRTHLAQRRISLDRTRVNVVKVENGRTAGDEFMQGYFLTRRTAASTILAELAADARESHVKVKVHSFNEEPIEGSDDLSMMVISGDYEGNYADLIQYVNRIDRSPRLLIIESLSATPQQGAQGVLNINIKFDTFVREDDGLPVVTKEQPETGSDVAPQAAAAPQPTPVVRQQQAPIMNVQPVQPVLPRPVPAQPQAQAPQPQSHPQTAPAVTQAPAFPPTTRPRLPMRMQMPRRLQETAEEDQPNPRPAEEEQQQQQPEQNQPPEQNPPQDQNQNPQNPNPPQDQNQNPQNPNPPRDNNR